MLLKKNFTGFVSVLLIVLFPVLFSSCLTGAKMDRHVAKQYNNQIPPLTKKKNNDIIVVSSVSGKSDLISATVTKTSNLLPLLFYWEWDYTNTCTLNPLIPENNFINTITAAPGALRQKLNGRKLELTIEQLPVVFTFTDEAHMIWLIHAFSWDYIYIKPEAKEMIVSYKVLQDSSVIKNGKINVPNNAANRLVRMFQSWKRAVSEYIAEYNTDIKNMTKTFINLLVKEL